MRATPHVGWLSQLPREGDYEIDDLGFEWTGRVVIRGRTQTTPGLGDRLTIENGGASHEVAVRTVTMFHGGWSVACRRVA